MKSLYRLKPAHALFALIAVHLILAFLIGNEYGQAWDEPSFYLFGERSLDAYLRGLAGLPLIPEKHIFFLDLRYYGAFYTAIGWKIVDALQPFLSSWGYVDVWHFVNFIFFQTALISLYVLASFWPCIYKPQGCSIPFIFFGKRNGWPFNGGRHKKE